MGRTYTVFPAVLVRAQVLSNNLGATYLPPEEIEASVEAWNGIPVVLRHPEKQGQPISARSPEVLNERGTGFLFRARFEDEALKADVFLDPVLMESRDGGTDVLSTVNSGTPAEISTGFGANIEERDGVRNGESFELILRDVAPDHLALLVEDIGACSVSDGCGLAQNEDAEDPEEEHAVEGDMADNVARKVWAYLKRMVGNETVGELREALDDAVSEAFGAQGTHIWIPDDGIDLDAGTFVYELMREDGEDQFFRAPYTLDETTGEATIGEPQEVERITEFVPIENGTALMVRHEYLAENPTPQEGDMKRDELLNALCECEKVALRRETLEAMSDEELAHYATLQEVGAEEPEASPAEKPEAETAVAPEGEEEKEPEAEESDTAAAISKLVERFDSFDARLSRIEDETEPARNQAAEERKRLVSDIAANSDFEEDELVEKPTAELRKLHKAAVAKPVTFAGLGGPRKSDPSTNGVDLGFEVRSTLAPQSKEN